MNDEEFREKWIAALRSGDFKQGRTVLRSEEDEYCCLGVACSLLPGIEWKTDAQTSAYSAIVNGEYNYGSLEHPEQIGITDAAQDVLISLNDSVGLSFDEIAAVLEQGFYGSGETLVLV